MIWPALLLLQAGAAPPTPADVVVTARPLAELRADWQACLAGGCNPRQEMKRALDYAEAQVLAGDYPGGWSTLRTAKQRNWRYAETLPVDVARVVKASARLADLNGQPRVSRVGMIDGVDLLKRGLDGDDARVLVARLDIGDAFVPEGRVDSALDQYRRVEKAAVQDGLAAVAAEARYRHATLLAALATTNGGAAYAADARRELTQIAASRDPAAAEYRDLARLVLLNLVPERRRLAAVDALMPTLTPRPSDSPVLAYAPATDLKDVVVDPPAPGEAQQWADIAFRIQPNGRVTDVAATARSAHLAQGWLDGAMAVIAARRYVPLQLPPGDPGVRRTARVTFVLDEAFETKSKIGRASEVPRVDIVDLTRSVAPL